MAPHPIHRPRQIWANPDLTTTAVPPDCTPFRLPSGGVVSVKDDQNITLTQEAIFQPLCTARPDLNITSIDLDEREPFYSSAIPLLYAIAAVTVVSYLLVIILFITPRTFFVGGSSGGGGILGQRGMFSGASGGSSVVGVGGRPWLQKVAALSVAISLTIASVDTFRVAQRQYDADYSDAQLMVQEVVSSVELRIIRVISATFLWLAQAQTLIRLFPRHKEKVIIKWAGFVLIGLDTVFSILNNFVKDTTRRAPRRVQHAVPALSYLFTFCLSLVYAAWIIYYSLSKRRYAFFHPKMRNICLVALLSLVAVLIPVVFFVLDISIYDVAGWGNYVRWVGAAAASVVVWEWVERIEALERDERKDGILGREIFDGDEMLHPSSALTWSSSLGLAGGRSGGDKDHSPRNSNARGVASMARRLNRRRQASKQRSGRMSQPSSSQLGKDHRAAVARPYSVAPASRPTHDPVMGRLSAHRSSNDHTESEIYPITEPSTTAQQQSIGSTPTHNSEKPDNPELEIRGRGAKLSVVKTFWDTVQRIPIPFLNRHMSPPVEVKQAVRSSQQPEAEQSQEAPSEPTKPAPYNLLERIGFKKPASGPRAQQPITIIPAPTRNRRSGTDVRLDGGNGDTLENARPMSRNTLSRVSSLDVPDDRLSRLSISNARPTSKRYSPAPFQASQALPGTAPIITEDTASAHSHGEAADIASKGVSKSEERSSTPKPGIHP
ncbi:MAG: hypothetical protein Q9168_000063 [Polycauliona sp. 1 TL-2023]